MGKRLRENFMAPAIKGGDSNDGPRLRGVIFDMDGVLVDSHHVHRKAWRRFLQTLGHDLSDSDLDFILDGRKRSDILRHFLGSCSDADIEEFGRRKDCIFRQMQLEIRPIPGVLRLVSELYLQGATLALATSASRSRAHSTLHGLGLADCFSIVVTGDEVPVGKPDSAIYKLACVRIGLEPHCLLAVEDALAGVQAAVTSGLCCIGVASHETKEKLTAAGAVHVVPDFESISASDLEKILVNCDTPADSRVSARWRGSKTNFVSADSRRLC